MGRFRPNWKRLAPWLIAATFALVSIRKVWEQEYIHAAVAGALALIYLVLGLRGKQEIAPDLSDSTSEISEFFAGSENGQDL